MTESPTPGWVDVRLTGVNWKPLVRVLAGVGALLFTIVILKLLASLFQTLVIATFLAIGADAIVRRLQRLGMPRGRAIAVVLVSSATAIILSTALLLGPLVTGGANLVDAAPQIVDDIEQSPAWEHFSSTLDVSDSSLGVFSDILVAIPASVASILPGLVGGIFSLVNLFIAVTFLLVGGDRAVDLLLRLVPHLAGARGWPVVVGTYTNVGRYIVGATVQAICAGTSMVLVLFLLDVPFALPLGMFMLLMDFIPLIGATIGAIPAVAAALVFGGWFEAVITLVFIIFYQQVENTIIQPRIQGKVVRLPGIAIYFSVLVGSQLLGILGALIAVPVASVGLIVVKQYLEYTGRDSIELPRLFDPESGNSVATAHEEGAPP